MQSKLHILSSVWLVWTLLLYFQQMHFFLFDRIQKGKTGDEWTEIPSTYLFEKVFDVSIPTK